MHRRAGAIAAATLALWACSQSTDQRNSSNAKQPANTASSEALPTPPATGPDARTPLAEPKTAVDPRSAEAAAQVVQSYGALIEQRRWSEAEGLWNNQTGAKAFTSRLKRTEEVHLEIGNPGDLEGAAGSIYITVPVILYGDTANQQFRSSAEVVLRRINDVPGSTEAQRHWHIERIDWSGG